MSYLDYELLRKLVNVKPNELEEPLRSMVHLTIIITIHSNKWQEKFQPEEDTWIRGYCDALNTLSKRFLDARLNDDYLTIGIDEDKAFF